MWMNEHEVVDITRRFSADATPNLAVGAGVLYALMMWTNANSDGWPFWPQPGRAAATLMDTLRGAGAMARKGTLLDDIREADLNRALRPVKAFLTRQGIDWNAELPWAAILPAA